MVQQPKNKMFLFTFIMTWLFLFLFLRILSAFDRCNVYFASVGCVFIKISQTENGVCLFCDDAVACCSCCGCCCFFETSSMFFQCFCLIRRPTCFLVRLTSNILQRVYKTYKTYKTFGSLIQKYTCHNHKKTIFYEYHLNSGRFEMS